MTVFATMVRTSKRQAVINRMLCLLEAGLKHLQHKRVMGLPVHREEQFAHRVAVSLRRVQSNRCLKRGCHRKRRTKFWVCLETDHEESLDAKEFKFHFRVTRACFWELVLLIKNHDAFKNSRADGRGKAPKPAEENLLVLLKHFGCEGNAASSISLGNFFGISVGAVDVCKDAALEALLSLEGNTHSWPSAEERRHVSTRIKDKHLFPDCVGLTDGTLLPLQFRPLLHGENCLSRKKFHAVVMLVVCDDNARTLHCHVGWPGSVHDDRVWRTCNLFNKSEVVFSPREHSLGDSAFAASAIVMPPFKSTAGISPPSNETAFNTLLAKPRVKSEHCIGILKGRFPFLKGIRLRLGNRLHMKRLIDHVRGAVVLHNFLINEPVEASWVEVDPAVDDLEPEATSHRSNEPDCRRRKELLFCLSELPETAIN